MQPSFSSVTPVTQAYFTILLEQEKAKLTNTSDLEGHTGCQNPPQHLCVWVVDESSKDVDSIAGIFFSLLFFP